VIIAIICSPFEFLMSQRQPKRPGDQLSLEGFFAKRPRSSSAASAADAGDAPPSGAESETVTGTRSTAEASSNVGVSACSLPLQEVQEPSAGDTAAGTLGPGLQYGNLVKIALSGQSALTDPQKLEVNENRRPPVGCPLAYFVVTDKRKQSGTSQRFLQRAIFDKHEWLGYYDGDADLSKAGVFCVPCVLFPTSHREGSNRAEYLISKVHQNFKKIDVDAGTHGQLGYHVDALAKLKQFLQTSQQPDKRIDTIVTEATQERVQKNRAIIMSILRCLELAGRQGLALRGHRDDLTAAEGDLNPQGNFHALLRFAIASGDNVLQSHMANSSRNALYVSKTAQNQLLTCMADELIATIIKQVKESHFYGIQADEVSDVSGWEQLGLSIRYGKDGEAVEKLISFSQCKSVTGVAICNKIVSELQRVGLDPKLCRAQAYDGAGSMSGHLNGCQAKFAQVVPRAQYFHCASHQLNLALTKACSLKPIQCMLSDMKSLGIFFKYSPKRQRCLETCTAIVNHERQQNNKPEIPKLKLKLLSATRWVERHTALHDFIKIYEAVIFCLEVVSGHSPVPSTEQQSDAGISHPEAICKFDSKSVTDASGLLHALTSDSFIVSLHSNAFTSGYLKGLSVLLQGSHLDVIEAYCSISSTAELLQEKREMADETFKPIYATICDMTSLQGRDSPVIPRITARQTQRSNVPTSSPIDYWRISVFVPFLDFLITELNSRFSGLAKKATVALLLLPANVKDLTAQQINDILTAYGPDLPDADSYVAEVDLWRKKWSGQSQKPPPATLKEAIKEANPLLFPNISCILRLLLIIPVTSANVERANSTVKFIKTDLRSRMSEARLNALVLLFCHKSVPLNLEAVVNRFATTHPRRMLLVNPAEDEGDEQDPDD
jgi:hypothetical protein